MITISSYTSIAFSKFGFANTLIKQATSNSSRSVIPKSLIPSKKPIGDNNSIVYPSISSDSMKF